MIEPSSSAPDLRPAARGLLIGFLVLSPVVFWYGLIEPFESCKSTLTQLTALAFLVLAVVAARERSWPWAWGELRGLFAGPIGIAVLCGVLSALVSTVFSQSPRTSWQGAPESNLGLVSVLALAILFAAGRALCPDESAAERVLGAAVVGLALSCSYALVQALGFDPVRWARTWEYHGWLRPSGTQGHPNYVAGHAVMVLPITIWQIRRAVAGCRPAGVLAGSVLVLLAVLTVTVSLSRAALLAGGLAVLVLLVGWRITLPRKRTLAWCLVLLSLCLLVLFAFGNRLETALLERISALASSPGRWPIWKGAVQLFVDHPWTGSGLDTFGLTWPGVRTPEYWEVEWGFIPGKAHNDFLHALATQGIFGAVVYAMLPLALLLSVVRMWRSGQQRGWVMVLASIALAFYVQNLVGFAVASTSGLLAIVAGMTARLGERQEGSDTPDVPGSGYSFLTKAACLGVLVVLVTLWQGGGRHNVWCLALVALALAWGAIAGLASWSGCVGSGYSQKSFLTFRAWRPVVLTALVAMVPAWFLLAPLAGSALSFRAEEWMHRDSNTAIAYHDRAIFLASWCAPLHERRARSLWRAAAREGGAARRKALLLASRESIESACLLEPLSASLQSSRARILFDMARLGLLDAAEVLAAFDRALALDRCDWFVLADAARAAVTLGYPSECERYLEPGLSAQPRLGMLLAERGALELARGQPARAERSLHEAMNADWFGEHERFDRATLLLGKVLLDSGQAGQAMSHIQAVLERRNWLPARLLHALCREQLGQKKEAMQEYCRLLRRQPDNEQTRAGVERLARESQTKDRIRPREDAR